MPSSITQLILFIACLAPGAAFLAVHHRGPYAPRSKTTLHEMSTVVFVSLVFDAIAIVIVRIVAPHAGRFALDLPAFVASPGEYARGSFDVVGVWFMLFIGLATILAALGAGLLNGARMPGKLHAAAVACRLLPAGAARTRSGWTHVVREFEPDAYKQVTCLLDDGTRVVGWLASYSTVPEDVPDRDVVLAAPLIFYRPDGGADVANHGALSLSARSIRYLYVDNWPEPPSPIEDVDHDPENAADDPARSET
ncbi:DUF6338 family protein [Nocardioides sp. NBC_00368]|uniref:DUF6338 family protein n=1 Tax=Nocardioides sp. NBC_00368 TaxID=2976000 RepID=UPI002E1DB06C